MNIAEFVALVALMCSFETANVSREKKELCAEWWTNCAVRESQTIERSRIRTCNARMDAEIAAGTFPNNKN